MATKTKTGYRHYRDQFRNWYRLRRAETKRNQIDTKIIAVTGSSAKSTTTLLLMHILQGFANVRSLALANDVIAAAKAIGALRSDEDFFIVEAGAESPGNLAKMGKVVRPDVAIVTLVALEHKSVFRSTEGIMNEKAEIVAAIRPGGFAVLNADDPLVMSMASRTAQRVVTFGQSYNADYRVENVSARFPHLLSLNLIWGNNSLHLTTKFVGEHFWLPSLAAAATALELGVPKHIVSERIATFEPVFGRCSVTAIPNGPTFIVDTTKAPWHSLPLAFGIIENAQTLRKRIVLGHMSDFAGSNSKYRDAFNMAREIADEVIFVGNHSHRSKASLSDRANGRFREFSSPKLVADYIHSTAVAGELILLKGSVDLHLERVALSYQHKVECWPSTCGKKTNCMRCGLYNLPFDTHRGRTPSWRTKIFGHKRGKRVSPDTSANAV